MQYNIGSMSVQQRAYKSAPPRVVHDCNREVAGTDKPSEDCLREIALKGGDCLREIDVT